MLPSTVNAFSYVFIFNKNSTPEHDESNEFGAVTIIVT